MPASAVRRSPFAWAFPSALAVCALLAGSGAIRAAEPALLNGAVAHPLVLDETLLTSFPPVTVDVSFETGEGRKSATYTGILLWALLEQAKPVDATGKNAALLHTLIVTGRDGYGVALAIGEIDPHYEGKQVILAYQGGAPPASFEALRLVIPGDGHGGRSVRDVARLEIR